jgi:hypothetical protein
MTYAARPPNKKPLLFPVPHDDVTTRLLNWIREIVESNHELVNVSERLRFSFKEQLVGASVRDTETILWQVELAPKDPERSRTRLRRLRCGGRIEHNPRAVRRRQPRVSRVRT